MTPNMSANIHRPALAEGVTDADTVLSESVEEHQGGAVSPGIGP